MSVNNPEKEEVLDRLFHIAIQRYHQDRPTLELTIQMQNAIWYSIYGVLQYSGEDAAYEYVKSAELLF